jgi:hypothetical protein
MNVGSEQPSTSAEDGEDDPERLQQEPMMPV